MSSEEDINKVGVISYGQFPPMEANEYLLIVSKLNSFLDNIRILWVGLSQQSRNSHLRLEVFVFKFLQLKFFFIKNRF